MRLPLRARKLRFPGHRSATVGKFQSRDRFAGGEAHTKLLEMKPSLLRLPSSVHVCFWNSNQSGQVITQGPQMSQMLPLPSRDSTAFQILEPRHLHGKPRRTVTELPSVYPDSTEKKQSEGGGHHLCFQNTRVVIFSKPTDWDSRLRMDKKESDSLHKRHSIRLWNSRPQDVATNTNISRCHKITQSHEEWSS